MTKNNDKSIEQASTSTLESAASSGIICGSKKTVEAAMNEIIRRTTF